MMAFSETFKFICGLFTLILTSVNVQSIPLENFYPFGVESGDAALPKVLDTSSSQINFSFTFFGQSHNQLYVSYTAYNT